MTLTVYKFSADIKIIGINPFVFVPDEVLQAIFRDAGKDKGYIPVSGTVCNQPYKQTLVRYNGAWRLYINTTMVKNSPKRVGETIELTIAFDPKVRTIEPHPKLVKALNDNQEAKIVFDSLSPSRKHEIIRYISFLKTEASVDRNVSKAINFLLSKGRFAGRDKP